MTFFNRKEEVVQLELTREGRRQLSLGNFKPAYYEFLDDDILYDRKNLDSDGNEEQNEIKKRIKDKLFPSIYETFSIYKGKTRKSNVEWDNSNNVLKFKNTPKLDLKKVNKIPQNTIFNVLDPFTALINTIDNLQLNNSCINKFRIFDGRRRYDLEMIELSRSFLKKDRPKTYEGNVIVCGLRFYPIGGHYLDSKWKPENDKFSDIKLYFGFLNKKVFPVRMEINRWFGSIITRIIFT